MEVVMDGVPWNYENHMIMLEKLRIGAPLKDIPLFHINLRVGIHNLPIGMMKENVGRGLGNYIGEFLEYDANNKTSFWRKYMKAKVRFYVRKPLKIAKKIVANNGDCCKVQFKYERLGILFCDDLHT